MNYQKKLTQNMGRVDKKILEKCDIKPKELYTKLRIILTGKQFGPSMNNLLTLLNIKK